MVLTLSSANIGPHSASGCIAIFTYYNIKIFDKKIPAGARIDQLSAEAGLQSKCCECTFQCPRAFPSVWTFSEPLTSYSSRISLYKEWRPKLVDKGQGYCSFYRPDFLLFIPSAREEYSLQIAETLRMGEQLPNDYYY